MKPINGLSWRQYLKIDNLDVCNILSGKNPNEYVRVVFQDYFRLFPNMPHKCPVEEGNYSAKNVTINTTTEIETASDRRLTAKLPNGVYRHTVRLYDDKIDLEGFMLFWHVQIYDSMGEDRL